MTTKFIECENCEGSGKVKKVEEEEVEEDDNEVCEV